MQEFDRSLWACMGVGSRGAAGGVRRRVGVVSCAGRARSRVACGAVLDTRGRCVGTVSGVVAAAMRRTARGKAGGARVARDDARGGVR